MSNKIRKLLEKFNKLDLPRDQYVIFGSGPLAIRGIREGRDLDVIVYDELFAELKKRYRHESEYKDKIVLEGGDIEIFPARKSYVDKAEEAIEKADAIEGYRFMNLKDLIRWKNKLSRPKDHRDIEMIKDYLKKYNF